MGMKHYGYPRSRLYREQFGTLAFKMEHYVKIIEIEFDDYIKERCYSEKLNLDLIVWETASKLQDA